MGNITKINIFNYTNISYEKYCSLDNRLSLYFIIYIIIQYSKEKENEKFSILEVCVFF